MKQIIEHQNHEHNDSKQPFFAQYNYIQKQLQENIVKPKAFLNPLLSLYDVAQLIGSNTKYLSRYMKDIEHSNFTSFINHLRVVYSATLLLKDREMSIAEVSYASGFNSQSTFLRAFRTEYNQTPSVYRQTNGMGGVLNNDKYDESLQIYTSRLRARYPKLSRRELELCHLILRGYPTELQAKRLGITYGSLLVTRSRLREKLGVNRSDHLALILNEAISPSN